MEIHSPALLPEHHEPKSRILVLTTEYPTHTDDPSGGFLAKLLQAISRRGYALKVLAPSDGTFRGRRTIDSVDTVRFGYVWPKSLGRLTGKGGRFAGRTKDSLLAKLQVLPMMLIFFLRGLTASRESHVIYANRLEAGIVGAALSRITGKPLVMYLTSDESYLIRDRWIWRAAAKRVLRRAAMIVPVSKEVLDIMLQLGVPETTCHLPRFGVDMEMFHPPDTGSREKDQVRLLFVGSLIERKGLHDLIEALGDPVFARVQLLVAGEGIEQPRLAALSEQVGVAHRVRWLGPRPQADVAGLMRSADLFCLPSHMEGRPNVVHEAMASGLPVIAARVGGIPEMVREGETALLFEPGNIDQLKACLTMLVAHADMRHAMGAAGHTYLVQSRVMWNSLAEEYDALFSSLASGSN